MSQFLQKSPEQSRQTLFEQQPGWKIQINSTLVQSLFERLKNQGATHEELLKKAEELKHDQEKLAFYHNFLKSAEAHDIQTVEDLGKIDEFLKEQPSWWEQNVEDRFEKMSETQRDKIPEGFFKTKYDIETGIAKGVYHFGKGIVVGIWELGKLAYNLGFDAETQKVAKEFLKEGAALYFQLQFGNAETRRQAMDKIQGFTKQLAESITTHFKTEWEKATDQGKRDELIAQWTTQGVLEVATLFIAVTKGARAAKAVTTTAERVTTTQSVATKAVEATTAVTKAKRISKFQAPVRRLPKKRKRLVKSPEKAKRPELGLANDKDRKNARRRLRRFYTNQASVRHANKDKLDFILSGTDFEYMVRTHYLEAGDVIEQWVRIGGKPGTFCSYPGADPNKLGISGVRTKQRFLVTDRIRVMESRAASLTKKLADGVEGAGGEMQLSMPPNWERKALRVE